MTKTVSRSTLFIVLVCLASNISANQETSLKHVKKRDIVSSILNAFGSSFDKKTIDGIGQAIRNAKEIANSFDTTEEYFYDYDSSFFISNAYSVIFSMIMLSVYLNTLNT